MNHVVKEKNWKNSTKGIHLLRLRLLPESGGGSRRVVVAVREIHEREEIVVPGVVVAIVHDVSADVVKQLVIQGLAVAAAADEVSRERALEEATRRDLAAEGELHLRGLGCHRASSAAAVVAAADAKKAETLAIESTDGSCEPRNAALHANIRDVGHRRFTTGSLSVNERKTKHNTINSP